jgi:ribosomal protein S18 acetylase RimI-like enzyme
MSSSQIKELFDVFLSAFLAQDRLTSESLTTYFHEKIIPRIKREDPLVVLLNQDKIIGFALFEKWGKSAYYLAEMAILPAYQRKGLGKKLTFSVFDKDPFIQKILLVTEIANTWAQAFYESIGFKRSCFVHPDYPIDFIGYEYAKEE